MNTDVFVRLIFILLGLSFIIKYLTSRLKKINKELDREISEDLKAFHSMTDSEKIEHLAEFYGQELPKNEKENINKENYEIISSMTKEEREEYVEGLYKKKRIKDLIFERNIKVFIKTLGFILFISSMIFVWHHFLSDEEIINKIAPFCLGIITLIFGFDIILTLYHSSEAIKEEKEKFEKL